MPLKMNNIHEPSVAARRDGVPPNDGESDGTKDLPQLMREKEALESELGILSDVLASHGVAMQDSLTVDGFPRDDVDVAQIRTTRARIIRLRNDYKAVMTQLEAAVHSQFAALRQSEPSSTDSASRDESASGSVSNAAADTRSTGLPMRENSSTPARPPSIPFAKVNSVVSGSPADQAGLQAGDEILAFGNVNFTNHERLTRVAQLVQRSQDQPIAVLVQRSSNNGATKELVSLDLTPHANWGGRGLLGCHLLPATNE